MKKTLLSLCGFLAFLLVGCGGSGGSVANNAGGGSVVNPPPVQAASGFSEADLSGTYALGYTSSEVTTANITELRNGVGTIQLDGNGGISGGSITDTGNGGTCVFSVSGTYNVSANGAGAMQATLTLTSGDASTCGSGGTGAFALELGQSGNSFVFASTDNAGYEAAEEGTAVKQQ